MNILVVIYHVANIYSELTAWYYNETPFHQAGVVETAIFAYFHQFVAAYTMGLLFLIAGYFVPSAFDKKGAATFIKDRLVRLGVPFLIYSLVICPFILYVMMPFKNGRVHLWESLVKYVTESVILYYGSGPLWFALALLIFSIAYALFRVVLAPEAKKRDKGFPKFFQILLLILLIGGCTFLVRIILPMDMAEKPDILNMRMCHFSQYITLFVVGIQCRRGNWLEKLSYKTGRAWLIGGLSLGTILYAVIMISGGAAEDFTPFIGGVTWQSAALSMWETFVGVSMSIGLIALFKEKFNWQNKLVKTMSDNAFSVYVFHPPIITALALLFAPVNMIPFAKFVALAIVSVPVCFLITQFTVRKVPFLRKIFA